MATTLKLHKAVRAYLADIGRRGGSVSSPAKLASARLNATKPRPRKKGVDSK
jgi:hypothetical protein